MTTTTVAVRDTGTETCRLTIVGPAKKADLTMPGTVTISELLPLLARQVTTEDERDCPWVLQRLGESPLDVDQTPGTLGLRDGDVLYLRPAQRVLPALEFDDVAVGVASVVSGHPARWRREFTRWLLLGLAGLALVAYLTGVLGVRSPWPPAAYFAAAAAVLAVGSVTAVTIAGDVAISLFAGLPACLFAAAAATDGFAVLTAGRVQLAGLCAAATAIVTATATSAAGAATRRPPAAPYLAVVAVSTAATVGASLARVAHWDAARAAAVLAVVVFITGTRGVRVVLRAAGLRAPNPPANADELQLDAAPEPRRDVTRRTATAIACLDGLAACLAVVTVAACVLLARGPGRAGWALAALLSCAVLLRARVVTGAWQRAPITAAGAAGLMVTAISLAAHAGPQVRLAVLFALLAAAGALLAGAWRLPAARPLPVWGYLADIADVGAAVALVPLLLQVLHVYSALRSMIG